MFLEIPTQHVLSTKDKTYLTYGSMKEPLSKDILSTVREQVLDFGHGEFVLRQYHHGPGVPLGERTLVA